MKCLIQGWIRTELVDRKLDLIDKGMLTGQRICHRASAEKNEFILNLYLYKKACKSSFANDFGFHRAGSIHVYDKIDKC